MTVYILNESNMTAIPTGTEVLIVGWNAKDLPYIMPVLPELRAIYDGLQLATYPMLTLKGGIEHA